MESDSSKNSFNKGKTREEKLANIILFCPVASCVCKNARGCPMFVFSEKSLAERIEWLEDQNRESLDKLLEDCRKERGDL